MARRPDYQHPQTSPAACMDIGELICRSMVAHPTSPPIVDVPPYTDAELDAHERLYFGGNNPEHGDFRRSIDPENDHMARMFATLAMHRDDWRTPERWEHR